MMQEEKAPELGQVIGVSLGPGDPDLITVKGLQALQQADKIFFPGSEFSNGRKDSYALAILKHYGLDADKLEGFYFRMSLDRSEAVKVYDATFQRIAAAYRQGLRVVIVSEGDASTFSTFSYLLPHLAKAQIPVTVVPGITSYALVAAVHAVPLSSQDERMVILSRVQDAAELQQCLQRFDTVVLMKIRSVMAVILPVLQQQPVSVYYGERMGTPQQFISQDLAEISGRDIPYFALMIVKKKRL